MITFEEKHLTLDEVLNICKHIDRDKYIIWLKNTSDEYVYISETIDFPENSGAKENFESGFKTEKRFGLELKSLKIPIFTGEHRFLLGISIKENKKQMFSSKIQEISKVLNYIDNEKVNVYVKTKNNFYTYLSKGCYEQTKTGIEQQYLPIEDTVIFSDNTEMLNYVRKRDSSIMDKNEIWAGEEVYQASNPITFFSVKIPFNIDGEDMMLGYSVKVQKYIDKIESYKQELSSLKLFDNIAFPDKIEKKIESINHDISSPINTSLQIIEVLKLMEQSQEKRDYLDALYKTFSSIRETIKMLIRQEFSIDESKNKVSFSEIKELIIGMFELTAMGKNIELSINQEHNLFDEHDIYVNINKLKRIIINLVNNAIKYTEEGHIIVNFSSIKNFLVFTIEDTGIGFETKKLDSIRRGEFKKLTKIKENSGFGWQLILNYAKLLNAKICIVKLSKGSKVYVSIPYTSY